MMISPEGYYTEYLEGKTAEEIASEIRGLKREISRLKKVVEHPFYERTMLPDERTKIWCYRLYLERAVQAYKDAGGDYKLTKAEQKAAAFDEAIPAITKIELVIGGFFNGMATHTVRLDDNLNCQVTHSTLITPADCVIPEDCMTKEEFLNELRELHIGEWRHKYSALDYGVAVMDGIQWELTIEYGNGRKAAKYSGDNAYPFSFDRFEELFGIGNEYEEDDCN